MTEITRKIESIRNMKEDLNSIKIVSQKNTEKMFQDLAAFRERICNEMCKIETVYQSGSNHKRKEKRKKDQSQDDPNFDSYCNETSPWHSKQMNFILKEIENVQKKSKEMLIELESYSEPVTDSSTSLSQMHTPGQPKDQSSTDTFGSCSNFDDVNVLFSKQLPHTGKKNSKSEQTNKESGSISPSSGQVTSNQLKNENDFGNENDVLMTKDKIDNLTRKLKDIQTQNDELRNVNENIQNLLVKLNDLKYVDAETVDKLETVKKGSQLSGLTYFGQMDAETVLTNENYHKHIRSVQITSKCTFM